MALYAIGDTHLSLRSDKPMDVFGGGWEGYVDKLREGFAPVEDSDTVVRHPGLVLRGERHAPLGEGVQPGAYPAGGVPEGGGGAGKDLLSPLPAPVPGVPLPGDHRPAGAVSGSGMLLWASPRGQPPSGHRGGAGECGLPAGVCGLCRVPSEKNFRLSKKTVEISAPI